ncbi:MAG: hypothetical protein QOJ39_3762 [Candidatus Eremiobacteraeota bacterium]|jgi:hypothetical protein|nr:hypothetical protein [Candidatus Eremiobacteraeota bacterium]MEA2721898.1 hypothetical protein [Candidatus Eremiobacteraeota bacterium]
MDYLVDCRCTHDLTRHDDSGCHGSGEPCGCARTKLEALDSAIDQARLNPWSTYERTKDTEAS